MGILSNIDSKSFDIQFIGSRWERQEPNSTFHKFNPARNAKRFDKKVNTFVVQSPIIEIHHADPKVYPLSTGNSGRLRFSNNSINVHVNRIPVSQTIRSGMSSVFSLCINNGVKVTFKKDLILLEMWKKIRLF